LTGYKYLEISINVGPSSYVEIAIGDHRGNELILSLETWKELYEQRGHIQNYLWNRRNIPINSISVGSLTVQFGVMNNAKLIRLESFDVRLAMIESMLLSMFNLDRRIDIMFDRLNGIVEKVDAKFKRFASIASSVTKNVSIAIRDSDYFDENQFVDCELLALVFGNM